MAHNLSAALPMQEDINTSIEVAYEYFKDNLADLKSRPDLFGKKVYVQSAPFIEKKQIGFWHLISMNEVESVILPCTNDEVIELCEQNCQTMKRHVFVNKSDDPRAICMLRASRLPWIVDVINLANAKDPSIKCWIKTDKSMPRLYIRYQKGSADYLVVFIVENNMYRLLTAYPVFMIYEKKNLEKDFKQFKYAY
jgi:hypothetical protein